MAIVVDDLGVMPYRQAWERQQQVHAEVLAGAEERILLVEHPPVITCGRRPSVTKNLVATPEYLQQLGVEFVESDRGGDITFHGPGQLVAYPIVRLIDHKLSVGGYVRRLEQGVMNALAELGIAAQKDECAVGVWVDEGTVRPGSPQAETLAKICALGVRIRRGVSMHGIALNVTTDLNYFNLIVPCGLNCRPVTSIQKLLGDATPSMDRVKSLVSDHLMTALDKPLEPATVMHATAPRC